jgi:predicted ATPase/class 3 adenylate cyclase
VRELPTGTVTFLFTDVEGSTRLLDELGDRYAEVLAKHRRVLREAFSRHGGVEVDTQGDAFFVAFAKASDALAAAAQGRAGLDGGPIRVRMGLHTGEPLVTDEGYVGIDVHRAARIVAAGYGGQILVSQSTRDVVGADLRDLGEHRLKDLTAPERIYQLGDDDFPPLKSLNATNLPVAASALVGRERELEELQALLSNSVRLVTLTGAGGSGKTRLGLQVAAELLEDFPGGVFFVPLAGVAQPELVPSAVTGAIGIRDVADLRDRTALLVIDNFEHLLEGAAAITTLLSAAPNTKVLATSRAPLRLDGEREYPLDPLPADDAVELLTQRARAVRPDFEPDESALEICQRLDGLPLALELAASRLRSLDSNALLERLERRLPLLTVGRRDAPERQRTLRATIEWSYELLPAHLRYVFGRLAVFAGTFAFTAAEEMLEATFDDLDALVEASLLKVAGGDRLLMLETIREFAAERLAESGEAAELRRRHAEYFLTVAQSANLMNESEGEQRHDLAIRDRDNLYAALDWTLEANEIELGLRIAVALENYWAASAGAERKVRISELLDRAGELPGELRAQALRTRGAATSSFGDYEEGTRYYEEALAEYRRLGDERGIGIMELRIAVEFRRRGDLELARVRAEESLRLLRKVGFAKGEAQALTTLAGIELAEGNDALAFDLFERALATAEEQGFTWWRVVVLYNLAYRLVERGRLDEGEARAREALPLVGRMEDRVHGLPLLALLARSAALTNRSTRAGCIWGAVEADEARAPVPGWEEDRAEYASAILELANDEFERGREEGRRLTLDEAIEYALSDDA